MVRKQEERKEQRNYKNLKDQQLYKEKEKWPQIGLEVHTRIMRKRKKETESERERN